MRADSPNRKALVTGAAGGIGRAIVKALHAEGVIVTGVDLQEANADFSITGDLRDPAFCDALPIQATRRMGGLDIIVNKIATNLKVFPQCEELVDLTLTLFQVRAFALSSNEFSPRFVLCTDDLRFFRSVTLPFDFRRTSPRDTCRASSCSS